MSEPWATASRELKACIPGFFSFHTACQLLKVGVLSISMNGRPAFRLRIRSWPKAVAAAVRQSRPSGSQGKARSNTSPLPCQAG